MLSGIGDMQMRTTALAGGATAQKMIEMFLYTFEFTQEAESAEAQGYVAGKRQTKSTAESTVTSTFKVSTQYLDWAQLGFTLDQFEKLVTSEKIPILKRANVPSSSPYEVTDAAISAANDAAVATLVYVNAFGSWGQPGSLARATTPSSPSAGQVGVDTTNTKLVFNAAQAKAPVTYSAVQSLSSVKTYGGAGTPSRYGNLEYWGKLYTPEGTEDWIIWFPNLQRKSRPSISIQGDVPTLEMEFGAVAPSGWEEPYKLYNMDTVV